MIGIGEKAIVAAIQAALADFQTNITLWLPQIFAGESAANQAAIQQWWTTPGNAVTVNPGYPQQQVELPTVAVTAEGGNEDVSQRYIGSQGGLIAPGASGTGSDVWVTRWQSQWRCHCMGPNQDFVLWLQMLVRWALLYERRKLEQEPPTGAMLMRQSLSVTGLIPTSNFGFDAIFPFERSVILAAQHNDSWTDVAVTEATSASVTLDVT